jgi:hypothetical protein
MKSAIPTQKNRDEDRSARAGALVARALVDAESLGAAGGVVLMANTSSAKGAALEASRAGRTRNALP